LFAGYAQDTSQGRQYSFTDRNHATGLQDGSGSIHDAITIQTTTKRGKINMTTQVTVKASLSPEKEVEIKITDGETIVEQNAIQNGEEITIYVYDGRTVSVKERPKATEPAKEPA